MNHSQFAASEILCARPSSAWDIIAIFYVFASYRRMKKVDAHTVSLVKPFRSANELTIAQHKTTIDAPESS